MATITLKRKISVGPDTPLELIDYLSESIDISSDLSHLEKVELLNEETSYPVISTDWKKWNHEDWIFLSRFVNPRCSWNPNKLIEAFRNCTMEGGHRRYGVRTNETPVVGDIVDAYNECQKLGFVMNKNTSYADMVSFITFKMMSKIPPGLLSSDINSSTLYESLTIGTYDEIVAPLVHSETINSPPKTEWDAFTALLSAGKDMSLANSRLIEYYMGDSHPVCERIQNVHSINKLRLSVGYYFNPLIPIYYYDDHRLASMARLESIPITSKEEMYDSLTFRSYVPTFHHLLQPEVSQEETLYTQEDLSEVPRESIVCFGVLTTNPIDFEDSDMQAYTISELAHMFSSNMSFASPVDNEPFSDSAINKLYNICRGIISCKIAASRDAQDLLTAINKVRTGTMKAIKECNELISTKDKDKVYDFLRELLELGMYMRGWDGKSKFPMGRENEVVVKDEMRVDEAVRAAKQRFDELDVELGGIASKLKLVSYEYGTFAVVSDPEEGLTIRGRLDIVDKGVTHHNLVSCIRWSSNVIISSSYCYLMNMDRQPQEFNISELRQVG